MLKWILILLAIAAVAGLLGMPRLSGAAAFGAQALIVIALIVFVLMLLGVFAIT